MFIMFTALGLNWVGLTGSEYLNAAAELEFLTVLKTILECLGECAISILGCIVKGKLSRLITPYIPFSILTG